MITGYRSSFALVLAAALIGAVGCASSTTRTTGVYVDDARIADEVKSRIVTDPVTNAGNLGVTSSDGIVYLTGTVPSADRLTRASQLAGEVRGVRSVVNNMVVATAAPTVTTVMTPAPPTVVTAPPPTVVTTPAPATVVVPPVNVVTGQPPVDVTGTVARYDPQNAIVTFQDGRAVRMTTDSRVAGPLGAAALQPNAQVTLLNVQPIAYQSTPPAVPGTWRIGTVSYVDAPNGLIYLTDGTAIRVGPSAQLRWGNQLVALSQVQPGSQVAISVPATTSTTTVTVTPAPATVYGGSALPRQTVVPLDASEVRIFVVPR